MVDETLYITPHEAALAVVATAMKKARLRLNTLIINSIVGGILFSAGGMLHLVSQAENPVLWEENPGIVHFMQGMVYPIGLFYVIMMGAELYNSNILYFSVGVCRGAVSIFDLLISWSLSWLFNLGGNLIVCYFICHLSGTTKLEPFVKAARNIAIEKCSVPFIQTFLRGIAANFCVCLAVYLQLLAKPPHVKLIVMALPIFTFVSMGFNHVVADMYLVPMGLIEGADVKVWTYIWKTLLPATLGNAFGGSLFGIVIPWYLHLVVVERDRELLNLPQYQAKDEQPELEMDSRVVRVRTQPIESSSSDSKIDEKIYDQNNPVMYTGAEERSLHPVNTSMSKRSAVSQRSNRSPPGVFPVMGMGEPLARERTIADNTSNLQERNINDPIDDDNGSIYSNGLQSTLSLRNTKSHKHRSSLREAQQQEEADYKGYNPREHALGETLRRAITRTKQPVDDVEHGTSTTHRQPRASVSTLDTQTSTKPNIFHSLSNTFSQRTPETTSELHDQLRRYSITSKAASASDNIAGIDSYDFRDALQKPKPAKRKTDENTTGPTLSPIKSQNDSSISSLNSDDTTANEGSPEVKNVE